VGAAILDEEAYRKQAEAQGMHILASLHSEGLPYVASALVLTSTFAKDNPNTVLATLKGLEDGVAYFADEKNKSEVMALMGKLLRTDVNDAHLAQLYDAYHTRPAADPYPDKVGMDTVLEAMRAEDPARYGKI